ncbi:MAG: NADH-quinone oxidoreductase subunit NuoE [Legionellaceae bacterium]|nr:NADH-quinone oxidoreductase subunit NuoE [Legionellaceae bacterium]
MSDNVTKIMRQFVSAAGLKEINSWVAKYPSNEKQSAVMSALMVIQQEKGYITSESMDALAAYLAMPAIAVYEVVNFYTMYERNPIGRHLINVCTNISCKLRNSAEIVSHLENKLKIKLGETTKDGRFTLRSVECLGACVQAPMMQVNKDYHENLTPDVVNAVLEQYE